MFISQNDWVKKMFPQKTLFDKRFFDIESNNLFLSTCTLFPFNASW